MREGVRVHVIHYRLKCDKLKLLGKLVVQHSIRVLLGGGQVFEPQHLMGESLLKYIQEREGET